MNVPVIPINSSRSDLFKQKLYDNVEINGVRCGIVSPPIKFTVGYLLDLLLRAWLKRMLSIEGIISKRLFSVNFAIPRKFIYVTIRLEKVTKRYIRKSTKQNISIINPRSIN